MSNSHNRDSSGVGVAVAAVAVVALMVVVLIGGAVAFWFMRATVSDQQALVQAERAMAQQAQAEAKARIVEAQMNQRTVIEANAELQPVLRRHVMIAVDQEGRIQFDRDPLEFSDLATRLRQVRDEGAATICVQVDERCLAAHVLNVVQICQELGLEDLRLEALDSQSVDVGASE